MAEKPPAFVVHDRRKFTSEGEIREGYTPPPVEEIKAAVEPAPASRPEPVAATASAPAAAAGSS